MKYLEYKEKIAHGTLDFPIAYYHVDSSFPRYQMPCHWHEEYEIIHIIKGTFSLVVNSRAYELSAGMMAIVTGGMLHGGIPEECEYECLLFNMNRLLHNFKSAVMYTSRLKDHLICFSPIYTPDYPQIAYNLQLMFGSAREKKAGHEFVITGSLLQLLGFLLEQKCYFLPNDFSAKSNGHLENFKKVLNYIEANYSNDITLSEMAGICGMNPNYFCRYFKQMTQMTPMSYLSYYRIESSKEQLASHRYTITEVAMNCGFHDISYFIRKFYKEKGMTPKEYQKSLLSAGNPD